MKYHCQSKKKEVVMIGGGIVNLVTAHYLLQHGYHIELFDAGFDPRDNAPWTSLGCTHGGDDARMFTLSEMDNYNSYYASPYKKSMFRREVSAFGWDIRSIRSSQVEQTWINEYEKIPPCLAREFNDDVFSFNRDSKKLWDEWINQNPDLFSQSFKVDGILRIYSDFLHYRSQIKRQNRIGALLSVLSSEDVATQQPILAMAANQGLIAGGINVVGFTLNIHKFTRLLISQLEASGVNFHWEKKGKKIFFDKKKNVLGVDLGREIVLADHFVISPGAYANGLLNGTACEDKINGVLGAWARIPNLYGGLRNSLKLARKGHITEDANITIAKNSDGQEVLIIGSGYGYTGVDPHNINKRLLTRMFKGISDTAEKYFPEAYELAVKSGTFKDSLKYCVRPWTSTSLGLFEILTTAQDGYCIISGGHNTGGFTQSPVVANAVLEALRGNSHTMHLAYHPMRLSKTLPQYFTKNS